jgi:signal peptidase
MSARTVLATAVEIAAVVVVLSLVAGQALGTPVLLSYVETGSMAPTMEPGDGFVAVPAAVTGPPEPGDVVTFRAEEIQGGGLTTHRVVGETDRGYVTRGDANPFTDQDGGEPPVKAEQIVAVAWAPGGSVLVVPGLGTGVVAVRDGVAGLQRAVAATLGTRSLLGTQGLLYLLLGLSAVGYVLDLLVGGSERRDGARDRSRDRDDGLSTRLLVAGMALLVVGTATASMVVPAGSQEFGVVSAEFESESPTVIRQGTSATVEYGVPNAGLVPVQVYLDSGSDRVAVDPARLRVGGRGSATADVTLRAPPETGYYRYFLTEHRYLAVLPAPVIDALYRLHPWLPIVAIDAVLGVPLYLLGIGLAGTGRIRTRARDAPSGLRRLFSRLG